MNSRGFTLLELLIAIAIFAVLGLATYRMLDAVMRADTGTQAHERQLRELVRAMNAFERDITHLIARPVRDQYGETLPALQALESSEPHLEFSHSSWRNPQALACADVQRVRWQVVAGEWRREYWHVLDRAQDSATQSQRVLGQVNQVSYRYLDHDNQWQTTWPPFEQDKELYLTQLPKALELTLEHAHFGQLRRMFLLPQGPRRETPAERAAKARAMRGEL